MIFALPAGQGCTWDAAVQQGAVHLDVGWVLLVLVVPAEQGLAAQQGEPAVLLGARQQHLPVVEQQQQHTHTEAQDGLLGTDHSTGHSGCTSHDTAEMNSMDCSDHEPAKQSRISSQTVYQIASEVTAAIAVPAEQKRRVVVILSCVQVVQLAELHTYVLQCE